MLQFCLSFILQAPQHCRLLYSLYFLIGRARFRKSLEYVLTINFYKINIVSKDMWNTNLLIQFLYATQAHNFTNANLSLIAGFFKILIGHVKKWNEYSFFTYYIIYISKARKVSTKKISFVRHVSLTGGGDADAYIIRTEQRYYIVT